MEVVRNKRLILLYRLVFIALCIYGLCISFYDNGKWVICEQLHYFTILSNVFCLFCYLYLVIKMIVKWNEPFNLGLKIKGFATMAIMMTGLTFFFVIRPSAIDGSFNILDVNSLENIMVHYIIPIMALFDYIMFDEKGHILKKDHYKWLAMPVLYLVFVVISAKSGYMYANGSSYPYEFINFTELSLKRAIFNCCIFLLSFDVIGLVVYYMDKHLSTRKKSLTPKQIMNLAFTESMSNRHNNFTKGGPFGAVIVDSGNHVIASAHNTVVGSMDPSAHAEINCIRKACKKLRTHDLKGCILYTSCYPCPMCMSAIIWANIKEVYYGNTKEDADKIGFRDDKIYDYFKSDKKLIKFHQLEQEMTIIAFKKYKANKKKTKY